MTHRLSLPARWLALAALLAIAALPPGSAGAVAGGPRAPLGAGFTYQGRLEDAAGPVSGVCDFLFGLWDAASAGTQIGNTQTVTAVNVAGGLFTVTLNAGGEFGASAFDGQARWLEIAVRCPAGAGGYSTLAPRQPLTAAPYASYAAAAGSAPWSGLTGVPAGFADGIDNDTTYSPGYGLSLTGTTFDVVTGTVQARVTGTCAAGSAIRTVNVDGTVICEPDTTYSAGFGLSLAGTTFRVVTSTIQARVTGTCAAGSTVRAVRADGSVECWTDATFNRPVAPADNAVYTLDGTASGSFPVATVGTDGLPLVFYIDEPGGNSSHLRVAHCNDVACSSASTRIVDATIPTGQYSSAAIGADGLALVSYFYYLPGVDLRVAHCSDVACTSATITTVDSAGDVGGWTSVTIGADGLGLISYTAGSTGDLKVAHCSDAACTAATITTVDSAGNVGEFTGIVTGLDGLGLISYYDATNGRLKVAHCDNAACTAFTLNVVDAAGTVGQQAGIAIGADGLGLIGYYDATNGNIKVAHCSNATCSSATISTLDHSLSCGYYCRNGAITVGADGLGLLTYYDATAGRLRVAHCNDVLCTGAAVVVPVTTGATMGSESSVTIGADGLPIIQYRSTAGLSSLHCANLFCAPYFRRR